MVAEDFPWPSLGGGLIRLAKMVEAVSAMGEHRLLLALRSAAVRHRRSHRRWTWQEWRPSSTPMHVNPQLVALVDAPSRDTQGSVHAEVRPVAADRLRGVRIGPVRRRLVQHGGHVCLDGTATARSHHRRSDGPGRRESASEVVAPAGGNAPEGGPRQTALREEPGRREPGECPRLEGVPALRGSRRRSRDSVQRRGRAAFRASPMPWLCPTPTVAPSEVSGDRRWARRRPSSSRGACTTAPTWTPSTGSSTRWSPRLWEQLPGAQIRLVGTTSPGGGRSTGLPPSSWPAGFPRSSPNLARADIAVVPLRIGSGTRLKILESFAHRIPVVSTTVGADGLDVEDGVHLLLADRPEEFADACRRLIEDRRWPGGWSTRRNVGISNGTSGPSPRTGSSRWFVTWPDPRRWGNLRRGAGCPMMIVPTSHGQPGRRPEGARDAVIGVMVTEASERSCTAGARSDPSESSGRTRPADSASVAPCQDRHAASPIAWG